MSRDRGEERGAPDGANLDLCLLYLAQRSNVSRLPTLIIEFKGVTGFRESDNGDYGSIWFRELVVDLFHFIEQLRPDLGKVAKREEG